MSGPLERIQAETTEALKAGDKERVSTLRLLSNSIHNEAIRSGEAVDEAGFIQLVRKAIKQRKDSVEQYRKGNRDELADKEEREAEILSAYMPAQADEAEIRAAIVALVEEQGLSGPAGIGVVMKSMMAKFAGQADGGTINRIAREILEAG